MNGGTVDSAEREAQAGSSTFCRCAARGYGVYSLPLRSRTRHEQRQRAHRQRGAYNTHSSAANTWPSSTGVQ